MNAESAQNPQADRGSTEEIRAEIRALKDDYAEFLNDHAKLAAMEAELTSGMIHESDNEALNNARTNIDSIRNKLNDIHSRISTSVNSRKEDVQRLTEHIERNPLTTVIAAFGIGYLIARILGPGGRR